jgi:flagellar biosynthesis/type III secretory pathway chaperone
MPADSTILALQEQVSCYQRLAKLAEVQHDHVQQGQIEGLLEVLQKRQVVLDQLSKLEQTIAPAKRQWSAYVAKLPAADRTTAESLLAETRRLLEQITAADRDDVMVLQHRKLNIGRQINKTDAARQVNRTYAAAAYGAKVPRMDVRQ